MRRKPAHLRRGTILLMVVALLAMLFIVMAGFLTLAKFDRETIRSIERGARIDAIIAEIQEQVQVLAGDVDTLEHYETRPGAPGMEWLSSPELVKVPYPPATIPDYWDVSPRYTTLGYLRYPVVSKFNDVADPNDYESDPRQQTLLHLIDNRRDDLDDADFLGAAMRGTDGQVPPSYMDAAGTGIVDSGPAYSGGFTSQANRQSGIWVNPPSTNQVDPEWGTESIGSAERDAFERDETFDSQARYEVAARVIPHAGVDIGAGYVGSPTQWFARQMYGWLSDGRQIDDGAYAALAGQRSAIEPLLRKRGGLVYRPASMDIVDRVPPVLRYLEETQPQVFAPETRADNSQRFNIYQEVSTFANMAALDAETYNTGGGNISSYNRRQWLTTVSNSDEITRKLDPDEPVTSQGVRQPGVFTGQLKYYLGEITDPANGAFNPDGSFNENRGREIIRRLMYYYYDMLSGHLDWNEAGMSKEELLSRLEQARMLAVNTVAAAAPYNATDATVDSVWYLAAGGYYYGYAPQPYFTELAAYKSTRRVDPNDPNNTAVVEFVDLGIELYNPFDRPLNLDQYAITVNVDTMPAPPWYNHASLLRLRSGGFNVSDQVIAPRSFIALATYQQYEDPNDPNLPAMISPNYFGSGLGTPDLTPDGTVLFTGTGHHPDENDPLTISLWRRGSAVGDAWYLVDSIELEVEEADESDWYATVFRDTTAEPYFGRRTDSVGSDGTARWRMTMATLPDDDEYMVRKVPPDMASQYRQLVGRSGPSSATAGFGVPGRFGPTIPLYIPNGQRGTITLNGTARPASLPTPGFLLFVPRYTHFYGRNLDPNGPGGKPGNVWQAQSELLAFEQHEELKDYDIISGSYPADFGHMPVLDNRQSVDPAGYFAGNGEIPWGLLVFDYFTTLDTRPGSGLNGYEIPGRININTAPWYLLAGLPLIDLTQLSGTGVSPAFWDQNSGIMLGYDASAQGIPRAIYRESGYGAGSHPKRLPHRWSGSPQACYRLGAFLGQAIASYRDKIPYFPGSDEASGATVNPLFFADRRNSAVALPGGEPYRPSAYGQIRSDYGLLSIGELLNVKGFDSTVYGGTNGQPIYPAGQSVTAVGDYFKAVHLLAVLDSQYLTTRSNTFTAYVTLFDREQVDSSILTQVTYDRSNQVPRLQVGPDGEALLEDSDGDGKADRPLIIGDDPAEREARPRIIAEREIGYFNTFFDD